MSLNQFSPELLMEVFSFLLDVSSKIRLELVSRKFRDCIRNVESWKYNTTLTMSKVGSDELRSFLRHTKVVNTLKLDCSGIPAKEFASLFMFANKLKITHFTFDMDEDHFSDCSKNVQAVACCLGRFANTLEFADLGCCGNNKCPMLETFCDLLPVCSNLGELLLGYIRDDEESLEVAGGDPDQAQGNNVLLLDSLLNTSLSSLLLFNFYSRINGERLAAVCNTAKGHSLSTLGVKRNLLYPPDSVRFQLAEFCQALEPRAARAIRNLELEYIDCGWIEVLPTLPVVLPNLRSLTIIHSPLTPTAQYAMMIAQAIGDFLHASAQHQESLCLEITLSCEEADEEQEQSFGQWLWNSVNLIDAWRSGTKRTADMQHWQRTLKIFSAYG